MKIEEYPWSEEMANSERNSGSNDKKKTQCFLSRQLPKLSCHAQKDYTFFLTVEQL